MPSHRSWIRFTAFTATFLAASLVADPGRSHAQSVSIAWDRPGGPAEKDFTAGPVDLYVTVQGLSAPVKAMQVFVLITTDFFCPVRVDPLPEAGRSLPTGARPGGPASRRETSGR